MSDQPVLPSLPLPTNPTPQDVAEAIRQRDLIAKAEKKAANKRNAHGGRFRAGAWPTTPPFDISRRQQSHYFLVGYVTAEEYQAVLDEQPFQVFPWTEYLAERYGVGRYEVKGGDNKKSFIEVPPAMAGMFRGPSRENPPRGNGQDPGDDDPPQPLNPLDEMEAHLEQAERIRKRFAPAVAVNNPPPPPKPTLLDALTNPATLPQLVGLVKQLWPQPNPPQQKPAPEPSIWDRIGALYEMLGASPEQMLAQAEQRMRDLQAQEAAAEAAAQPGQSEP